VYDYQKECVDVDVNLQFIINGKHIKQVNEFIYLGHKLYSSNNGTAVVKHRIGLGWDIISKRVPYHIKAKIYKTYILPVVLYGLECVNWTVKLYNKVEIFQNNIMRLMTGY